MSPASSAARAEITLERNQPHGQVTVTVDNANFASKDAGVDVHGLGGTVSVNVGPNGVSIPAPQHLTVGRVTFTSVDMTDAALTFRAEGAQALLIGQLSANWLGGHVSMSNVRINPSEPKFEATLLADRIQLRELLAFAAEGRARGEGQISAASCCGSTDRRCRSGRASSARNPRPARSRSPTPSGSGPRSTPPTRVFPPPASWRR